MQRIDSHGFKCHCLLWTWCALAGVLTPCFADQVSSQATLSSSAYRVLGQPDLLQNGVNMVDAAGFALPQGITVDGQGHLYVADTYNHRVLAWSSAAGFQTGDAAALTLGQPT